MRILLCVMVLMQSLWAAPEVRLAAAMKTGVALRLHVVAQDDTDAMQRVKGCVRDAVRGAYAAQRDPSLTMLENTRQLLPALTEAAVNEARAQGFAGEVTLALEERDFPPQTLDGLPLPGGRYPALTVRLGDALGRNWWGLVDPALAVNCAGGEEGAPWLADLSALWAALRRLFLGEVPA